MVSPKLHRPARPEPLVVKPARPCSALRQDHRHCVVCGCELRGGHPTGDLVCDSHPVDGFNPRASAPFPMTVTLAERILVLMYRAGGAPLNLYRALGCDHLKTNCRAVDDEVAKLKKSGVVRVEGAGCAGRRLGEIRARRGVKVKA